MKVKILRDFHDSEHFSRIFSVGMECDFAEARAESLIRRVLAEAVGISSGEADSDSGKPEDDENDSTEFDQTINKGEDKEPSPSPRTKRTKKS